MDKRILIKKQLDELLESISGDDRTQAAVKLKCHPETIKRYLGGKVKKVAFGLELLAVLKANVAKREKALITA